MAKLRVFGLVAVMLGVASLIDLGFTRRPEEALIFAVLAVATAILAHLE